MQKELIDLKDFIPKIIVHHEGTQETDLNSNFDNEYIHLSYITKHYNGSWKEHSLTFPRFISKSKETFEVLGLLQAEGSKTQRGCFTFCNHEYRLINKTINWFERELDFNKEKWRWYIKVNINEPQDLDYKREIEKKIINFWTQKTGLPLSKAYPKTVTYISNTTNKKLKFYDKGTLIIEYKHNLFNNFLVTLVEKNNLEIKNQSQELILAFMRGVIAGESNVECYLPDKRYRVYITASKDFEREIFKECLNKINIESKKYGDSLLIISERENLVKLLKLRLMTLSPEKYSKFLNMMQQYPNISNETGYFTSKKEPWNKIPQEKAGEVIEIYKSGIKDRKIIAEKVEVSPITVNRILRKNNLSKKLEKTPESKRKDIAEFAKENPQLSLEKIAKNFNVHISIVVRSNRKYNGIRGMKVNCKIPQEKIQKIIQIYKENPTVKFSGIRKEVGVSSTVIKRVRKENNLTHLGYKYLIGCNNQKTKILLQEAGV